MPRFLPRRRRNRRDAGASLILAMVFIFTVSLVATSILGFSSASLLAGPAYDAKSVSVEDVDGALQAALTEVRQSGYNYVGRDPYCFTDTVTSGATSTDLSGTYGVASASGGLTESLRTYPAKASTSPGAVTVDSVASGNGLVAVTCAPGAGTGGNSQLVQVNGSNHPGNAILTLNPATVTNEPGLEIDNRLLTIGGRVFSNSTIQLEAPNGFRGPPNFCPNSPQPPTSTRGLNCVELYSKAASWPVIARGKCLENGSNRTTPPAIPPAAGQPHIFSTPAAQCNYGTAANAYGDDPGYPQPATAGMVWQRVDAPSSCSNSSALTLTLAPGYYDDASALSAWTNGRCRGRKTVVLAPGVYFFDFRNYEMSTSHTDTTAVPDGPDVWDISGDNVTVVGGQLAAGVTTPVSSSQPIPGLCKNPLDDATAQGVQLVFGGDSRVEYGSGRVEFCGTYSSSSSPLVFYGARADSGTVAAQAPPTITASGTPSTPSGSTTFTTSPAGQVVANLAAANEAPTRKVATATITRPNSGTAKGSVVLPGYALAGGATLPAGSVLTGARLTVTHQETGTRTAGPNPLDALSVTLTPAGGTALAPIALNPTTGGSPSYSTETIDLTDELVSVVHDSGLTGMSLQYDAVAAARSGPNTTWTANLDNVALDLTYALPSLRSEDAHTLGSVTTLSGVNVATRVKDNCLSLFNGPYMPDGGGGFGWWGGGSGSGCALIASFAAGHSDREGSAVTGTFYVQGTVYAPKVAVELILPQQGRGRRAGAVNTQAIRSGLIARSVRINVREEDEHDSARDNPGQIAIEVPNDSLGPATLNIYFTAYTCPSSTCTITTDAITGRKVLGAGWLKAGLARVGFVDGATVVPGKRQVQINAWQIAR